MNPLKKILDIILAVIIMIFSISIYMSQKVESITTMQTMDLTESFVSNIQEQGELTQQAYESYVSSLKELNSSITIDITHNKNIFEPLYDVDGGKYKFTGSIAEYTESIYSYELLRILYESKDKTYYLNKDDYITVEINSFNKTLAASILPLGKEAMKISCGGRIRNIK